MMNDATRHGLSANTDLSGVFGVGVLSILLVVLCVLIHYEVLRWFAKILVKLSFLSRLRVLFLMFGLIAVHLLEIWLYAFGYYYLDGRSTFGTLAGPIQEGALDYVYFSASTYTTLGYGDLVPVGPIRFLSALEALTGLLMIAWSSSFTFLEMNRFWRDK